ncbi:MAG: hypothetical protein HON78_05640 [Legionellales bacterium]|jgi:type II secretory pathway component HofQ|nr:hypothetical protein [Legionellales bacterium]
MKKIFLLIMFSVVFAGSDNPFEISYLDFLDDGSIALEGDKLPLYDLIKQLVLAQDKNIVFISKINGNISLNLRKVSVKNALDSVLLSSSLCGEEVLGSFYIGSCRDVEKIIDKSKKKVLQTGKLVLKNTRVNKFITYLEKNTPKFVTFITDKDYYANSITVVAPKDDFVLLKKILTDYDQPLQQIRIKAYLVSVDENYLHEFGLKFNYPKGAGVASHAKKITNSLFGLFPGGLPSLDVELRAIEQQGHGRILSSPELITANNNLAFIESGDEIPYHEYNKDGRSTVVFKKAVLSLKVLPEIISPDKVKIKVSISQDNPGMIYADALAIQTRKITTDAVVPSGHTLVLGGIFEQHKTQVHNNVPLLSELPLFGEIFKETDDVLSKRQLLIFLTPEIIS